MTRPAVTRPLSLFARNLAFTLVVPLLAYAGALAVIFHLFVTGYEERALRRRFSNYPEYRRTVPRWVPRPPQTGQQ